jgi:hypothetical protein
VKKLRLVLVCALVSLTALFASIAYADNGAETTPFKATYSNPAIGGLYDCSGVRIVKTAPNAFIKDSETCTISDLDNGDGTGTLQVVAYY